MAVASLVLGLLSLICGLFGVGFRLGGVIFAIIALILSARNTAPEQASMAKAGKVCAIIGLILCLLMIFVSVVLAGFVGSFLTGGALEGLAELIEAFYMEFA